jgi:hypothetical protein
VPCAICHTRKPRRYCPAVNGEICPVCCATGREESIDCPLGCEYLRDAHRHEKKPAIDASDIPNQDIKITQSFLAGNQVFLAYVAVALFDNVNGWPETTDWDIRDALNALIRTYRTLRTGLYYESKPDNLYAARISTGVQSKIAFIKQEEIAATGKSTVHDATILGVLTFLQRLEYSRNNGRRRSRAFIDFLSGFCTGGARPDHETTDNADGRESAGEPLIIL